MLKTFGNRLLTPLEIDGWDLGIGCIDPRIRMNFSDLSWRFLLILREH